MKRLGARQLAGVRSRRLAVVAAVGLCAYAGLMARAIQLQSLDAAELAARAERQHTTTVALDVQRGEIADRSGRLLAQSATVHSVAVSPRRIAVKNRARTVVELARVLRLKRSDVRERLRSDRSFVWVQRWVTPSQAERLRALELEGVELVPERRRFYPNGELAAAYLGFAGRDDVGLAGVELAFETALRTSPRRVAALRDEFGNTLVDRPESLESHGGTRLVLALDAQLQHVAERELDRALERTRARHATLVALDPTNGDVLALAERPAFDPNRFWKARPSDYRARAFLDAFEPGSTLKPFVIALALEAGRVSPDDEFDCENGSWRVLDRTIRDFKPHGVLQVRDILRLSSNIGTAKIADRLGGRPLVNGLRAFGFGRPSGSGFPGEASGVVHNLRDAQAVERANLAFGQGMTATALQLATSAAILATGGRRVKPRLALRIESGGERLDWPHALGDRVLSEGTARRMLSMMTAVVESGTGRAAQIRGVRIAGKTGTAQKVVSGRYSNDRYFASFIGIAPVEDPRLVMAVVLDEPQGVRTGGATAAPVFREVARFALSSPELASSRSKRAPSNGPGGAE